MVPWQKITSPWVVGYQVGTLVLIQFKTFGTKKEFPSPATITLVSAVSKNSTQEALRAYPITKTNFQVVPLSR